MSEKLKITITYGKTFNLGNYESERLTLSKEFYQDDININFETDRLMRKIEEIIQDHRDWDKEHNSSR